jgi:hypothetical protein
MEPDGDGYLIRADPVEVRTLSRCLLELSGRLPVQAFEDLVGVHPAEAERLADEIDDAVDAARRGRARQVVRGAGVAAETRRWLERVLPGSEPAELDALLDEQVEERYRHLAAGELEPEVVAELAAGLVIDEIAARPGGVARLRRRAELGQPATRFVLADQWYGLDRATALGILLGLLEPTTPALVAVAVARAMRRRAGQEAGATQGAEIEPSGSQP